MSTILSHFIVIGFLIYKRLLIDAFSGDHMLDCPINHELVILVILTVRFIISMSFVLHTSFDRLHSPYANATSHFICNPLPFKIFKVSCNVLGCSVT